MKEGITGNSGVMAILMITTLLIANLIVLFLFYYLQKAREENLQKEQADIACYDALQGQLENQRILIHDIRKHLGTIDALAKQSQSVEIERYISGQEKVFAPFTPVRLCTDPILNLLLVRFRAECSERGIQFHCDVWENSSTFLDAPVLPP